MPAMRSKREEEEVEEEGREEEGSAMTHSSSSFNISIVSPPDNDSISNSTFPILTLTKQGLSPSLPPSLPPLLPLLLFNALT